MWLKLNAGRKAKNGSKTKPSDSITFELLEEGKSRMGFELVNDQAYR